MDTDQQKIQSKGRGVGSGFVVGVLLTTLLAVMFFLGAASERMFRIPVLDQFIPAQNGSGGLESITRKILNEESFVEEIAEQSAGSVVTVSIETERQLNGGVFMDPFGLFGRRFYQQPDQIEEIEQDIGTGFVVDQDEGLVVTNKHVVSEDRASYTVITKDGAEFEVERIYRDPVNDLAILKISGNVPDALELGDSDNLRVGQFAMAIGTALGEFRHTVTTGVISGLGRGITAGDQFGGFVEELSNVIQTDAAINPGNSGGPLLNSAGQVIGVNTAVAQAQNIGFAIPISIVKNTLDNFNQTGQFDRPFLGVRYRMLDKEMAQANSLPEGAYIVEVIRDSAAATAGLEVGDIVTEMNGVKVVEAQGGLAQLINSLKVGEKVVMTVNREGKELELEAEMKLGESGE